MSKLNRFSPAQLRLPNYPFTRVESDCPVNTAELKINGLAAWLFTSPVAFMKLRGLPALVGQITHLPIYPFTHLPIYPFTHLPISPFTHLPIYPFRSGCQRIILLIVLVFFLPVPGVLVVEDGFFILRRVWVNAAFFRDIFLLVFALVLLHDGSFIKLMSYRTWPVASTVLNNFSTQIASK